MPALTTTMFVLQTELSNKIMKEVFAPRAVAAGIEVLAVVLKVDGDSSR